MIKRTLYFGNPCSLRVKNDQLEIELKEEDKKVTSVPIEDVGIVILDNPQITLTQVVIRSLNTNNAAIISCDESHLPHGLMLPMYSHHTFTEKVRFQVDASVPLKKNLWQQTVVAKIRNQARMLEITGGKGNILEEWSKQVRSGDPDNMESRAASYYWPNLFNNLEKFRRHRFGGPPNNLLNYGYAVLRAVIARSMVASGLIPAIGIHHRNKYNPYCLVDDIMEPYRPFVDRLVIDAFDQFQQLDELTKEIKKHILQVPVIDVVIEDKSSPLMVGAQRTTASLAACFEGTSRKLLYPEMLI